MITQDCFKFCSLSLIVFAVLIGCATGTTTEKSDISEKPAGVENNSADSIVGVEPVSSDLAQNTSTPSDDLSFRKNQELNSEEIVGGKKLSIPKITGSVPPRDDDYHDTENNAIVVLQSPTKAMADFPRDRRQEVDWVKTLEQGLIEPRADLKGASKMVTMDMDILMKNTQFMPWVRFPHIAHTKWLACDNCHPKIFIPQENANPISMNKVLRGEYCGVCHDKVAFSLFICERCHSVPHEGSGPAWWKK